jgi:hypothetical protein
MVAVRMGGDVTFRARISVKLTAIAVSALLAVGCAPPRFERVDPIASSTLPGQVLNLSGWAISTPLPSNESGAAEISQPALNTYRANFFRVAADGRSVVFITPTNGAVLDGAEFPRTELRQANPGGAPAVWSTLRGRHTLTTTVSIDAIPTLGKQTQVVGQVHSVGPYILLIQLDGNLLYVKAGDKNIATLNADYQLGTRFTYQFVVEKGLITVFYNGNQAATWATDCQECYFKAGSYLQIPPNKSRQYGQTTIYLLEASSLP